MTGPIFTGLLFSTVVILLSYYNPESCRVVIGMFFLISGAVFNFASIIVRPFFVYQHGMTAHFALYRDFTEKIIGMNPILFGIMLILFQLAVGLMILGKDRWVNRGLFIASLFMIMLIPLHQYRFSLALCVPSLIYLMGKNDGKSFFDMINEMKVKIKPGQNSL